jgi:hypothetical protein
MEPLVLLIEPATVVVSYRTTLPLVAAREPPNFTPVPPLSEATEAAVTLAFRTAW